MPIYAYQCASCGASTDAFNKIADRANGPACCGAPMAQTLTAAMVSVPGGTDIDYRCTITGEPVQSMRKRKYLMDKHGMVDARDLQPVWKRKEAEHQRTQAELKAFNDKIPEAVRKQAQAVVANPPAGA